jgi:DNA polymerase I-like protein with 3'-5' exonuclease and polymerase domains
MSKTRTGKKRGPLTPEWKLKVSQGKSRYKYEITDPKEKAEFKRLKKIRGAGKISNFSCTYGVAKKTLSRNIGMPEREAQKLIDTYWERNWSIKAFANSCTVKEVRGQRWIKNPVSGFWLTLRSDKDKFSTVNQSTAVFVFDTWIAFCRKLGITIQYQCHDEHLFCTPIGTEEETRETLNNSIQMVNDHLSLNVAIGMAPAFGVNYADCH